MDDANEDEEEDEEESEGDEDELETGSRRPSRKNSTVSTFKNGPKHTPLRNHLSTCIIIVTSKNLPGCVYSTVTRDGLE